MIYLWTALGYLVPLVVSLGVYEPIPPKRDPWPPVAPRSNSTFSPSRNFYNNNVNGNTNRADSSYSRRTWDNGGVNSR